MTAAAASLDRDAVDQKPWDLRLLPGAVLCWAGAAAGLTTWALASWWWCPLLIGLLLLLTGGGRRWAGRRGPFLVAGTLALAGWVTAIGHFSAADTDPLTELARAGARVEVSGSVSGRPRLIGADGGRPGTWWVPLTVDSVVRGEQQWRTAAAVTVRSTDPAWAVVPVGTQVLATGPASIDTFPAVPAVLIRVRGSPELVAGPPWWLAWSAVVAAAVHERADDLTGDAGALLPGLVLGDTSGISPELTVAAQATGLTHLLAVSGSHFAVVCGLVVLVLRNAGPRPAALGGATVMVALVILVGPQPSVVRAAAMASVAMLALVMGRTRSALPALFAAVIVLLLIDPTLALSFGFALSVLATGALVTLAPRWSAALQVRGWPAGWADLVTIPLAAGVVTAPVVAALSGSISLVSVPANILVAPVVVPALLLGLGCAVLAPWWPAGAEVLAELTVPLLNWVAFIARSLAQWPGATVPWPASPGGVLTLAGLSLAAGLALRRRRIRRVLTIALLGIGLGQVPVLLVSPGWPPAGWAVVQCDVGQGSATVFATADPTAAVVVDTGPEPGQIDRCLADLEITSVPLLVLTHLHADHIDGLPGLLAGRSVELVVVGPEAGQQTAAAMIDRQLLAAGARSLTATPGAVLELPGVRVEILGPAVGVGSADAVNDASVVTRVLSTGVTTLATGDIEDTGQWSLLRSGADLRAEVVVQPHHGSADFRPELLDAVQPRIALIGVGADNDYGHPAPSIVALLAGREIVTGRTDLDGDVAVVVTPDGLQLVRRVAPS